VYSSVKRQEEVFWWMMTMGNGMCHSRSDDILQNKHYDITAIS